MTRIIIPRGACCSSKIVSSSDFELYFCKILPTYSECGWTLSVPCPSSLTVCVASGNARFLGLHLNNTATCNVMCLPACMTSSIYATVTRDACMKVASWAFTTNTTDITPALSFKIGTATTSACDTTAVTTCLVARSIEVGSIDPSISVGPYNETIGDYTSPASAVSTSDGGDNPDFCEPFTTNCWNDNPNCCSKVTVDCACCMVLDFNIPASTTVQDASSRALLMCCAAISDSKWILRFKFQLTTLTANCDPTPQIIYTTISCMDSCTQSCGGQDAIMFGIITACSTGERYFRNATNGGAPTCTSRTLFSSELPAVETIFVQMRRTSTTNVGYKIYNCACFCCETDTGCLAVSACTMCLKYVKVMSQIQDSNSCGSLVGQIDDIQFWNNICDFEACTAVDECCCSAWTSSCETNPAIYVDMTCAVDAVGISINPDPATTVAVTKIRASTDATFTDSENVRTIKWSDFTDDTDNFIRFNRLPEDRRFIQVYGADTTGAIMSINEIKILVDACYDRKHGHLFISTEDKNLNLDGTPI